ncbi:hypothetical protein [Pararhodobacter marinus]|uniref:hypothetical protein n=1 Tax=Pararhodobacter marinus TaxID=2184063 RepID=UPI0035155867
MKSVLLAAGLLALPLSAPAQVIADCDWAGSAATIVEPWEQTSRTFANGAIRIAWSDTAEPACCAAHVMILHPSGDGSDEPAYRQCSLLSADRNTGFYDVDIAGVTASYDPAKGLLLTVPVRYWHEGVERGEPGLPGAVRVRINQATGTVSVE